MIEIPLKTKYRNPNRRTQTYSGGYVGFVWIAEKNHLNQGSPGNGRGQTLPSKKAPKQGWGVRRTSYGPFNTF